MKKPVKIAIIVLVLLLELAWVVWPRFSMHGRILDEPYRNAERKATLFAWIEHKSPETKAAYDAEVELLDKHTTSRAVAILSVGLAINPYFPNKLHKLELVKYNKVV
jgi:hypothetical protein